MSTYIKAYWKENLLLLFIITVGAGAQILAGILNARALNSLIAFNWTQFFWSMLAIVLMLGLYVLSLLFRIPYEAKVIQLMVTKIRTDITESLQDLTYQEFHQHEASAFISWLNNDITTIEATGFTNLYACITMIIEALFATVSLIFFHWSIVLFAFAISLLTYFLPMLVKKRVQDSTLEMTQEQEKFVGTVTSVLQGFDTLFSYNLVSRIRDRVYQASQDLADKKVDQRKQLTYSAILGASGNLLGQSGILVLTGYLAIQQIVTIGSINATEALSNKIFNSVGNITNTILEIKSITPIFEKFQSLKNTDRPQSQSFEVANNTISLNQLNYTYDQGDQLWDQGVSYDFSQNGKYAILGPSGSGKSTLFNILNGKLTDYQGSLRICGNEIKETKGEDIREEVMYLDQTPYIFEGTILDNISLGETFSEDQVWQALAEAGLTDYVKGLAKGLDTPVGEGGRSLSGGQKQRLALARGFIRHKNIVLVDEGTSSLDQEAALNIERNLVTNPQLTVIMITHNLRSEIEAELDGVLDLAQFI